MWNRARIAVLDCPPGLQAWEGPDSVEAAPFLCRVYRVFLNLYSTPTEMPKFQ